MPCLFLEFDGAEGGTRTRTDYSTRPSNVRGYQLRHLGNLTLDFRFGIAVVRLRYQLYNPHLKNYRAGAALDGFEFVEKFAVAGAPFASGGTVIVCVLPSSTSAAVVAGRFSDGASAVPCNTETFPVNAGIEINNAEIIKTTAAEIVIFDKTEAVPRGENAVLETLLVNNAPASVLPGCNSTETTSIMHVIKNNAYKI